MNQFFLTELKHEDIPFLLKWFNDSNLCKYMEDSEPFKTYTEEDILPMLKASDNIYLAFRNNDRIIGYASIYDINSGGEKGEFSFLIGETSMHGMGLGKILLSLLCLKARELKIKTLFCGIFKENIASIKCVQASGFEITENNNTGDGKREIYFIRHLL